MPAKAAGQVRIIGGDLRRSVVPVIDVPGLRPSPDRVRETLFNWLGQQLPPIAVLDAFAGTGALGLEALSRGAARVDWHETHPVAYRQLQSTVGLLSARLSRPVQAQVSNEDVCTALMRFQKNAGFRYDLVLLDPPFSSPWLARVLPLVVPVLSETGAIYIEWQSHLLEDATVGAQLTGLGLKIDRAQRAGQVHYHLLRRLCPTDVPN